ncbi:MAG: formylglycine-generating enzyme family protein, partial [Symploca sp. SIO2D2]|nr:formylglycine-generating enzyme family protein [Symploca sp. SIO2D2]
MRIRGEGNCATVEWLDQHLRYRVPEINGQYGKPKQRPYAIVEPASKYHLILLPPLTKPATKVLPARQPIWTRRQLIQIAGFGSLGLVGTVIANQVWKRNSSSPEDTTSPIESPSPPIESPSPLIEEVNLEPFNFEVVTVDSQGRETNREQRQAKFFAQDLGNSVMLDMVAIPGGKFMIGSPDSEKGRENDEGKQREVTVPRFFMGKYSVTQPQWKAVAALPKVDRDLKSDPSLFKGENMPVERVSWYDAVEFCARLSKKTGRTYRLPSEAEWEYACRAGTTTPFHFGETITCQLANYK